MTTNIQDWAGQVEYGTLMPPSALKPLRGLGLGMSKSLIARTHIDLVRLEPAQQQYHFSLPKFFSTRSKDSCFTERTPLLKVSSEENGLRCMAVHNTDFTTDYDSWENSSAEFEQGFQPGSEMTSLSRSASSSEKCEILDSFHVKFNLSKMRYVSTLCFAVNISANIKG
uniref:Uncharacterized protein n=1 Tax=Sphaerodactylus townsendi TaxID=933632 RepID=A0ACB8FJI0_9SAUR